MPSIWRRPFIHWNTHLFNTSLLLCCSTSLSFHLDFLKRQMFYTISLYLFFLIPSLTFCALVSTFTILLKLFCLSDFQVHSQFKAVIGREKVEADISSMEKLAPGCFGDATSRYCTVRVVFFFFSLSSLNGPRWWAFEILYLNASNSCWLAQR